MIRFSAFLYKLCAALRTADTDLSFSFGDADLLPAFGADIDMVVFPLVGKLLLLVKPVAEPGCGIQIPLVLRIPGRMVFGKHPEVCIDQENPEDPVQDAASHKNIHGQTDQPQYQQKTGELVLAISPLHKTVKFLFHLERLLLTAFHNNIYSYYELIINDICEHMVKILYGIF